MTRGVLEKPAPKNRFVEKIPRGFYGHSIGSTWGDIDNDGDMDLFVANLAHPRYIGYSNKSMLLRNDGTTFTDITRKSGVHYNETDADPGFADIDNDGDLDLFITSIYNWTLNICMFF